MRMTYFIVACYNLCDIIVAVYDTIYSNFIRKEGKESYFQLKICILMAMRDVRDKFS